MEASTSSQQEEEQPASMVASDEPIEMPSHYQLLYRVVVVGCDDDHLTQSTSIIRPLVRKLDGARVRLHVWLCPATSKELPTLLKDCAAVVVYYRLMEQLHHLVNLVQPLIPLTARVVRVCVSQHSNVGKAPYYVPMETGEMLKALDGDEDFSNVFWEEVGRGPDYTLMDQPDEQRIQIYAPGDAPKDRVAEFDFRMSVAGRDRCRCHSNCSVQ